MSEEANNLHGREKAADEDDPLELVMHPVPGGDPESMATCFIEEYARMGMEEAEILQLFSQPIYRTHTLYQERGEPWVRQLIGKVLDRTGRMRISVTTSSRKGGCHD